MVRVSTFWRALAAALMALNLGACAAQGVPYEPAIGRAGLVQVDVYDRTNGTALPVYAKDGRRYIVGTPGHEYAVRIRNATGARVLVVTSVDGVNVISGDTAAPSQSGYVLDAYGSVEIVGWRKSLDRTAAFFFTEHQNSYAARTGRPNNVGVIGVAAFRERPRPVVRPYPDYLPPREGAGPSPRGLESRDAAQPPSAAPMESGRADDLARQESNEYAPRSQSKLGTGHGRNETSRVRLVDFERASDTPSETITLRYDRRENLAAMGVLPLPIPRYTRREPEPFPGMRFAPDPDR